MANPIRLVTSYNAASGGSVVNQVQRTFNGLGQMTTEYQNTAGRSTRPRSPDPPQRLWGDLAGRF